MARNVWERQATNRELAHLPRQLTTAITWYMKEHGVIKAQLAQKMGVTQGRVSQILSGDENLTLRTLAAVCVALDAHLDAKLVPNEGERRPPGVLPSSSAGPSSVHPWLTSAQR